MTVFDTAHVQVFLVDGHGNRQKLPGTPVVPAAPFEPAALRVGPSFADISPTCYNTGVVTVTVPGSLLPVSSDVGFVTVEFPPYAPVQLLVHDTAVFDCAWIWFFGLGSSSGSSSTSWGSSPPVSWNAW